MAQTQRGRSVTRKPNFSIIIDGSNRNIPLNQLGPSQTFPGRSYPSKGPNRPAAQEQEDPEQALLDITSSDDTDQEEPEWTRVKARKSMEEMEKEIGKGKTKMGRLEEWNSTLKGIIKKRQASPGCTEENEAQRIKQNPPPPPASATQPILIEDTPPPPEKESMPRIPVPPPTPALRESTAKSFPPSPSRIQSDQQQLPFINQMMGQNQQCLQCSSWDHTTFNCHVGIHDSIKIYANCKRRVHCSADCKTNKVVLINRKTTGNYCLKIHYQTVLN